MPIPLIAGLISTVGPAIVKGAKKLFQAKAAKAIAGKIGDKVLDSASTALGNKLNSALNPEEAALARGDKMSNVQQQMLDFNASEAQKNRDFQQSMFDQQTKLANTEMQRKVADYQAAGLNPAALMGGGSSAGASLPSAGAGDSASAPSGGAAGNLSDLFEMQKIEAEISYMKAQEEAVKASAAKIKSETKGIDIDNSNKPAYWDAYLESLRKSNQLTDSQITKVEQETRTEEFRTEVEKNNVKVSEAQACIAGFEKIMKSIDAEAHQTLIDLTLEAQRLANDGAEAELRKKEAEIGLIYASQAVQLAQKGVLTEQEKSIFISNEIASATKEYNISIVRNQSDIARNQRVISGNEAYWSNQGVKYGVLGRALTGSSGSATLSGALAGAAVKFLR